MYFTGLFRLRNICRKGLPLFACAMLVSAAGFAQQGDGGEGLAAGRGSTGSIQSVAGADAALARAAKERAEIDARYTAEEQACLPQFFANSCIEQAKERRRRALSALRPIEIEANAFKRQARVAERDKALADRLAKDDADRQDRVRRESESAAIAQGTTSVSVPDEPTAGNATSAKQEPLLSDRRARHEAKLKQLQADEASDAQQRAANIAAYERKKQAALERQREVAQRKAEKEEKRKKREGDEPRNE